MLKGIGYAICVIDVYVGMFYNTVIGWAVYYFIASIVSAGQVALPQITAMVVVYLKQCFQYVGGSIEHLPWTSCGNEWNDNNTCVELRDVNGRNKSEDFFASPAEEYFTREVLEIHKSEGITRLGSVKPTLALSCLTVFILVYFALWKGVKSTGKVVWVTAIAPYIVLFCLLIRGITLDGASDGIRFYLTPKWEKLFTMQVLLSRPGRGQLFQ